MVSFFSRYPYHNLFSTPDLALRSALQVQLLNILLGWARHAPKVMAPTIRLRFFVIHGHAPKSSRISGAAIKGFMIPCSFCVNVLLQASFHLRPTGYNFPNFHTVSVLSPPKPRFLVPVDDPSGFKIIFTATANQKILKPHGLHATFPVQRTM